MAARAAAGGLAIKSLARTLAGAAALTTGTLSRFERDQREGLTILCYHRVLPAEQRARYHDADLVVTPEAFRAHCALLAERFTVYPLAEALARWTRGEKNLVALTFDDGYRDNITHAAPILRDFGLRATFFVVAGLVDAQTLPWYDIAGLALQRLGIEDVKLEIAGAKDLSPAYRDAWLRDLCERAQDCKHAPEDEIMASEELRGLADDGHEIGAHSLTHPILTQCSDAELVQETATARQLLREKTGQPIAGFCYPNGNYDSLVQDALRAAGYTYAASMEPGVNFRGVEPYVLRRWFVQQERLSGPGGQPSRLAMRMEWSGAADSVYRRARP
jgi:peptidoglycan/xylan/chitin deacetylase (PgdA/CDA1 family)